MKKKKKKKSEACVTASGDLMAANEKGTRRADVTFFFSPAPSSINYESIVIDNWSRRPEMASQASSSLPPPRESTPLSSISPPHPTPPTLLASYFPPFGPVKVIAGHCQCANEARDPPRIRQESA